jgi:hypothetical protein
VAGKGGRRVNTLQKCVHIHVNAITIPVVTIPGIGGEEDKGECWRG